jgi:hypothetical protein
VYSFSRPGTTPAGDQILRASPFSDQAIKPGEDAPFGRLFVDVNLARGDNNSVERVQKNPAHRVASPFLIDCAPLADDHTVVYDRWVFKTAANRPAPLREAVISVPTRSRSRTR